MRLMFCILITVLLAFPAAVTAADPGTGHSNIWDSLSETSGQALQLTRQGKYEEAKQMLKYFEDQFQRAKQDDLRLTITQLRILTTAYDHASRAVTNVSASHETRVTAVTQFYLVIDALHSENQPLWRSTKNQVLGPFEKMKQAAAEKNDRDFQLYLNQFLSKYEMIHPALNVDLKEPVMERLDSEVQFLIKHRDHFFSNPDYVKMLDPIEKDFRALYDGTLEESMEPALPWVILSIGGIIVVTLFYAGWQKYRAEKKAKRERVKKRSRF